VNKRFALITLLVMAFALIAVPAFAEGYNTVTSDATATALGYGDTTGEYTRYLDSDSGPHGGYTTTTNKCADCHSTHYASGSYMLLRANSREAACDYCHGGGGGSSVNIMMDNEYNTVADVADGASAAKVYADTLSQGSGTGHTLGYEGLSPADIEPAFTADDGLACFNCHTPHGNSARVLQSFGSPSRPAGEAGEVEELYGVPFLFSFFYQFQEMYGAKFDGGALFAPEASQMEALATGATYAIPYDFRSIDLGDVYGPTMAGMTPFIKYMGAPMEIGEVINTQTALNSGKAMGPLTTAGTETNDVLVAMGAWQAAGMPKMPDLQADLNSNSIPDIAEAFEGWMADGIVSATEMNMLFGMFPETLADLMTVWNVYYGTDVQVGNVNTAFVNMGDYQYWPDPTAPGYDMYAPGGYGPISDPTLEVWHKPLFFKGRFLLLKNPDSGDDYVNPMGPDMTVVDYDPDLGALNEEANQANGKKVAIDWEYPLGPAATWGPFFYTENNERFPLQFPWAPTGVAMENEMCTSCHDGAAGQSNQPAKVWAPKDVNITDTDTSAEGTYTVAYSHDSNNRGCARAQWLNPTDGDNFGPHCANCHTGASGCFTCHDDDGTNWNGASAMETTDLFIEGSSTYQAPDSFKASAVSTTTLGASCLDGGFSYPHRTLGANMLKDAIYGVDFDGTEIDFGGTRSTNAEISADFGVEYLAGAQTFFNTDGPLDTTAGLYGQPVQNLDSVCMDCHGNATTWLGDDAKATFTSYNPITTSPASWDVDAWELLLKGLP